jgi:hypothetical protein
VREGANLKSTNRASPACVSYLCYPRKLPGGLPRKVRHTHQCVLAQGTSTSTTHSVCLVGGFFECPECKAPYLTYLLPTTYLGTTQALSPNNIIVKRASLESRITHRSSQVTLTPHLFQSRHTPLLLVAVCIAGFPRTIYSLDHSFFTQF